MIKELSLLHRGSDLVLFSVVTVHLVQSYMHIGHSVKKLPK